MIPGINYPVKNTTIKIFLFRNRTFNLEVDIVVDLLTLKTTSNFQNNSVNGCFIQNHIERRYHTCFLLSLLKNLV